ncbi:MAG: hypothetical protein Q9225_005088 [Loekoesia sp. 1 TL-2023]
MAQSPSNDAELIERIQKLPPELRNQIEEWVFEMALCPGFLYPKGAREGHKGGKDNMTVNLQLLTVDRYVLTKYRNRIWSENTLVIGVRKALPTTGSFYEVPNFLRERIRKIFFKFTIRDMGDAWEKHWSKVLYSKSRKHEEVSNESNKPKAVATSDRDTGDGSAAQAAAVVYRGLSPEWALISLNDDLITIWYEKFGCIFPLSWEELTLGFTECYGFNGKWFGYDVINRLSTYDFRKLGKVRLLAPDEVCTGDVLRYIREMYDEEELNVECLSDRSTP